jgi:hypothetical protein
MSPTRDDLGSGAGWESEAAEVPIDEPPLWGQVKPSLSFVAASLTAARRAKPQDLAGIGSFCTGC